MADTAGTNAEIDDRIAREQQFHDERFSDEMSRADQDKYYWAVRDGREVFDARVRELSENADVLEYGCATGDVSLALAPTAKSVFGIDISKVAIEKAKANKPENADFAVMNAEEMTFEDGKFDFVFGCGIIHHLEVDRSAREIQRVLKSGGRALFWEPLGHNVAINMYRGATPEARTPDEHPLLKDDIKTLAEVFDDVKIRYYGLFTLGSVPFRNKPGGKMLFSLARVADKIFFAIPGLKWQAWYSIIEMRRAG